jgi:ABC-type oligopeptide transport system ATPase subunit
MTEIAFPTDIGGPAQPLLDVRGIQKHFPIKGGFFGGTVGTVHAVDGISFTIREGETLGIVGESGCGKSTTARLLMRMMDPELASMIFDGEGVADNTQAGGVALRDYRRQGGMARALELFESVQVPSAKRRRGLSARAVRWVASARDDRGGTRVPAEAAAGR